MDEELLLQIPDVELIQLIYQDERYLGVLYKKCQANCVNFLRIKNTSLSDAELEDIFSEAIITLLQKIRNNNFVLTASFQTYLNAVCGNMFLNKVRQKNEFRVKVEASLEIENNDPEDDNYDGDYDSEKFEENLFDPFEKESEEKKDFFERYIIKMTRALELMVLDIGNCYELITLFSYENTRIRALTEKFGYANDRVTISRRYTCLRRLKLMIGQIN
jgi:RNA polymerase sigma factor (sigma-70 family)